MRNAKTGKSHPQVPAEIPEADADAAEAEVETSEPPPTDVLDEAAARQRRRKADARTAEAEAEADAAAEEAVVEEVPKIVKPTMSSVNSGLPGVIPEAELAAITPAARQAMAERQDAYEFWSTELTGVKERIAEQEARMQSAKKRGSNYARAEAELALVDLDGELRQAQIRLDKLRPEGKGSATLAFRPESQKYHIGRSLYPLAGAYWRLRGGQAETLEGEEPALPPKVPLPTAEDGHQYKIASGKIAGGLLKTPQTPPGWEDTDAAHTKALKKINDAIGTNRDEWLKLKTDKQKYEKLFQSTNLRRHQEVVEDLDRQLAEKQRLVEQMERIRDVTLGAGGVRQAAANKFVKSNAAKK